MTTGAAYWDSQAAVALLDDPLLWGGPISDERHLLVSAR
jgi:hypothetical protein